MLGKEVKHMATSLETLKQSFMDVGQRLVERIGLEPPFIHCDGCIVRGGLTRMIETLNDDKITITRTCGACGKQDNYTTNRVKEFIHCGPW
ncbi:hypothetical protein A2363_03190 [Candidatus Gottesmanbacteria bacterium RIFOXYB1_FULL_47_11]|uniref:Uncharacterized protein n=1 Tax=Candidatus Gottesmanbacteria bacterium RIFOXYB1_FULL_47_11 TaxID=1798401 RepID=A0A1F6BCR2_9BACT|nr:MAG: hypothetical protein A2363_03190 [Candidatus Gottesmanbacteria bacterium RIFOXYB1_FULL_47_11]